MSSYSTKRCTENENTTLVFGLRHDTRSSLTENLWPTQFCCCHGDPCYTRGPRTVFPVWVRTSDLFSFRPYLSQTTALDGLTNPPYEGKLHVINNIYIYIYISFDWNIYILEIERNVNVPTLVAVHNFILESSALVGSLLWPVNEEISVRKMND